MLPGAAVASGVALAVSLVVWHPNADRAEQTAATGSSSTSPSASAAASKSSASPDWGSEPTVPETAVVRQGSQSAAGNVALTSYDASRHRAVLSTTAADPSPTAIQQVAVGDVIASAPSKQAPRGALFKVAAVTSTENGAVEVTTEPATLSDALGAQQVDRTIAASDLDVSLESRLPGLQVLSEQPDPATSGAGPTASPTPSAPSLPTPTWPTPSLPTPTWSWPSLPTPTWSWPSLPTPTLPSVPTPKAQAAAYSVTTPAGPPTPQPLPKASGTHVSQVVEKGSVVRPTRQPDGGILLSIQLPDSVTQKMGLTATTSDKPQAAAWVGLTPKLLFQYGKDVNASDPFAAEIGIAGDYSYGWMVHGRLSGSHDTGEKPLEIPVATLHYRTTQMIGPVPLVISADVTYFYRITASGQLSIDTEQATTGNYAIGAHYETATGWEPFNRNNSKTIRTPDSIAGLGRFQATIGTDMSFMLFDSIGLTGRLAPYLRLAVDAGKSLPPGQARLQLFIGIDCTGSFKFSPSILGVTLAQEDVPFPPTHREWKIADEVVPRT